MTNPRRREDVVGEAFYRSIRRERPRYEYRTCRRCGKEDQPHLAGRTTACITCRANRPAHKHRSKHGHKRKRKSGKRFKR